MRGVGVRGKKSGRGRQEDCAMADWRVPSQGKKGDGGVAEERSDRRVQFGRSSIGL